jgi:hypothetical protein
MNKNTYNISLLFFSIIIGGCLSVLVLFNLPLFYEQPREGFFLMGALVWAAFSLGVGLSYKILLVLMKYIKEKNTGNILFAAFLAILISGVIYFTESYYWSQPVFHQIKICHQSRNPAETLSIQGLKEIGVQRAYPATLVGAETYPILLPANTCVGGSLRTVDSWQGIAVQSEGNGSGGVIKIEINQRLTGNRLIDNDGVTSGEILNASRGTQRGTPILPEFFSSPALAVLKWFALIVGAIYLALFIFALSELILLPNQSHDISHRALLAVVLVYFIGFGLLMTNHGGQPDQRKHHYYSVRFSETWLIPEDDPKSSFHIDGHEYLYYWVNGAASKLYGVFDVNAPFSTHKSLWRFISVLMSVGTVFYVYRLTSRLTDNKFAGVLAGFFLANTLMFVFVSGGVSYDNLMNLCSAAAMYHLVSVLKGDNYIKHTALLGSWLGLGALAKDQVALLAFILFIVWLFYSIKNVKFIKFEFSRNNIILIVILTFSMGMFMGFYGGNLIKYQRPKPKCAQVKSVEVCTRFSYRAEQKREVDYERLWTNRNFIVGPFEYALNSWLFTQLNGIWGIVSHNTYVPKFTTSLHGALIIWMVFCFVRYWNKEDTIPLILIVIIFSYIGYVFFMNYKNLLSYNFLYNYAVQGRYLFPVISAFLAVMVSSFLSIRPLLIRKITLSLAIILYFGGGLGTFLFRYSDVFISWRI